MARSPFSFFPLTSFLFVQLLVSIFLFSGDLFLLISFSSIDQSALGKTNPVASPPRTPVVLFRDPLIFFKSA